MNGINVKSLSQAALKYPSSTLVSTLGELGSSALAADFRLHRTGEGPGRKNADLEIAITLKGNNEGVVVCEIDGEREPVRPSCGTIWLVPALAQSEEISIASPELAVLHLFLPHSTFSRLGNEYALPRFPTEAIRYCSVVCDETIEQIGRTVLSEMMRPSFVGRMLIESASLFLAARLMQSHAETFVPARTRSKHGLDAGRMKRVLDYIEEHYMGDLTVGELAEVACLSMYHFIRAFTGTMGVPPHRYISERRLETSRKLIADGQLSLTEIALRCQFSSSSSFARAFKRATGSTPLEYRRSTHATAQILSLR